MDKGADNVLSLSIQYVKGVGPKLASQLSKKGVHTIEDALFFLPRAYEDRRRIQRIAELRPEVSATVAGTVLSKRQIGFGRKSRLEVVVSDGSGELRLTWFHAYPSLAEEFKTGEKFLVHGHVRFFGGRPGIVHPDHEKMKEVDGKPARSLHFGRVVPIYSETDGLYQKTLRKVMGEALKLSLPSLDDPLPDSIREKLDLPDLRESFKLVHFPQDPPDEGGIAPALQRIIFEEFFVLQLGLGLKKRARESRKAPPIENVSGMDRFVAALPFALTGDQKKALEAVASDIRRSVPMSRLVQGDVGSGKTVVALAAAFAAAENGYQAALMAPTEILAQQHYQAAERWLRPLGCRTTLVTGGTSGKKALKEAVASGEAQLLVGTHALFQQGVTFSRLGLVIVDEQHRFGVEQRAELLKKAEPSVPHLLMLTATPIPRTLALTMYGDLDLTLIREKPVGRQPVETTIARERDRPKLYQKIRETVRRGEQAYLIYPLVEASEKLDLKSATEMYDRLRREVFPDLKLSLLHGRMKPQEKDEILQAFRRKESQILVATTVIEVGIDVATATLMIIEHAERLGLSQLHQLRGRVGRGSLKSECWLVSDSRSERLKVMEKTEDGFEIAEEDLKFRGPGEFLGTRQHGLPGFRVGHILRDASLLALAQSEARAILETDPELRSPAHQGIRRLVESRWRSRIDRLVSG